MDNYGTHKHAKVRDWLNRHPRFVCHFVPTSSSWLNLVERWFGELTSKRIRRSSFHSVPDLKAAIDDFLTAWNENPKPFVWTATVDSISRQTFPMQTNSGTDSAWLYCPSNPEKEVMTGPVISWTLH